jgi:hypothetical protein
MFTNMNGWVYVCQDLPQYVCGNTTECEWGFRAESDGLAGNGVDLFSECKTVVYNFMVTIYHIIRSIRHSIHPFHLTLLLFDVLHAQMNRCRVWYSSRYL